jgi:hypothetical protein
MQHRALKEAIKEVGIIASDVTHLGRNIAVRDASLAGTPEGAMKRLGRWNDGSMTGSYLESVLPMQGLRALAGSGLDIKDYYLPRGSIIPSLELQQMVFPKLEISWEQYYSGKQDLSGKGIF